MGRPAQEPHTSVTSSSNVAAILAVIPLQFLCKSPPGSLHKMHCIARCTHNQARSVTRNRSAFEHAQGRHGSKHGYKTPGSVAAKLAVKSVPLSVKIAPGSLRCIAHMQ